MKDLQFKHLPIHKAFMRGCQLHVKITATQAVLLHRGEKIRLGRHTSVSLVKRLNCSSFTQGAVESSYGKRTSEALAGALIAAYEARQ